MDQMKIDSWVMDIEVYPNYFCLNLISADIDLDIRKEFVVFHDDEYEINDLDELYTFFKEQINGNTIIIGFNNLSYDDVILHYIWSAMLRESKGNCFGSPEEFCIQLKKISDETIASEWSGVPEHERLYQSYDLYKIWHFNNKARSMSLKAVEAAIGFKNIRDLPYLPSEKVSYKQAMELTEYCWNDVEATKAFLYYEKPEVKESTQSKIELRKLLTDTYELDFINSADASIGERLMLLEMSKIMGISQRSLNKRKTVRNKVPISQLIFNYVNFSSKEFNYVLEWFEKMVVDPYLSKEEKKKLYKKHIFYDGLEYVFGLGGCHAARKGVWTPKEDEMIISCDVSSYYPNLAIKNRYYPEHLSEEFCNVYEDIYHTRKSIPKSNPLNGVYKLMLNGAYGKSNDKFSFLQDLNYTYTTTVNGQLLLCMLAERLTKVTRAKVLMVNTDGLECIIKKDDYELAMKICKIWESATNLELEYINYTQMYIRDVNNYISVTDGGKIKQKGCFEVDKWINKDHSQRIVPLALREYVVNGTPVEKTILSHKRVEDFFVFVRCKKDSTLAYSTVIEGSPQEITLQRTNRMIVSQNGHSHYKIFQDGRRNGVFVGRKLTNCNDLTDMDLSTIDIDYRYYIKECKKIIESVEGSDWDQLKLF